MPKILFVISSSQEWFLTLVKLVFKKKVGLKRYLSQKSCEIVWNGNKIYCILQPGTESKFDAYFNAIFGIWGKKTKGGGLNPKGKIGELAHFAF